MRALNNLAGIIALLLPGAIISSPAAADCPRNCIELTHSGPICSSRAAADTMWYFGLGGCSDSASYDIPEGILTAHSTASGLLGCGGVQVIVQDDFVVTGLPAGTPLGFTARFDVETHARCILSSARSAGGLRLGAALPPLNSSWTRVTLRVRL